MEPGDLMDRALFHVVERGGQGVHVQARQGHHVVLSFDGHPAPRLILRYQGIAEEAQLARIAGMLRQHSALGLEILLVGGPISLRERLEALVPMGADARIFVYHLREGGELWSTGDPRPKSAPLFRRLSEGEIPLNLTEENERWLAKRVAADQAFTAALMAEARAFQEVYSAQIPRMTYTLAILISAVFAFELFWGGSESTPVLNRMGALHGERFLGGEWWRLLASTFLHGGLAHIVMNGLVLVALGGFIERILGGSRFLILYTLSAAAGGLAHVFFGGGSFAVGASGGLWGILVAQAALAYRPRGYLPRHLVPQARKNALINMPINIVVSFLPFVAGAAHFGGGIVGGLLVWSGVLLKGLPRFSEGVSPDDERVQNPWVAGVATACILSLGASLSVAMIVGQPWKLRQEPIYVQREVPAMGLSVALPRAMSGDVIVEDGVLSVGDPTLDPGQLVIRAIGGPGALGEDAEGALRREVGAIPEADVEGTPDVRTTQFDAFPGVLATAHLKNGALYRIAWVQTPEALYQLESYVWPGFTEGYGDLVRQAGASLKPGAETSKPRIPPVIPALPEATVTPSPAPEGSPPPGE